METKKDASSGPHASIWLGGVALSGEFSVTQGTLGPWASDAT